MKIIGREIMWNLSQFAAVLMYSLLGVVVIIFAWGLYERIGAYRRGRTERENRLDNLWDRTVDALKIGLGQQKLLRVHCPVPRHLSRCGRV